MGAITDAIVPIGQDTPAAPPLKPAATFLSSAGIQ